MAAYVPTTTANQRGFPRKRSTIISQSPVNAQSSAAVFPDPSQVVNNLLPNRVVSENCKHLGDCLEALHARTSRLVQTPPAPLSQNSYFKGGAGNTGRAYDNEVLLEPIFTALPSMDNLLSIVVPFSQPLIITSTLGLGVQNRWMPDET